MENKSPWSRLVGKLKPHYKSQIYEVEMKILYSFGKHYIKQLNENNEITRN